ncbi:hypothetical protein [Weissella cibaria]
MRPLFLALQHKFNFYYFMCQLDGTHCTAQEGAFFNFDFLYDIKKTKIEKIPRVAVELVFDEQRNDDSNLLLDGLEKVNEKIESEINKVLSEKQQLDSKKEPTENQEDSFIDNVLTKRLLDVTIKKLKMILTQMKKELTFVFLIFKVTYEENCRNITT